MDVNWATSNCGTSMVQTVLYSRCTETTIPCSPYCTSIQYSSYTPTVRKKTNHQIHHGEMTNNKATINRNNKTTTLKLNRNERETGVEREAERERKEGKEV